MATTPNQEAIDTFISITGMPASVAVQRLREHEGDLNAAVNAYFNEGDNTNQQGAIAPVPEDDVMDIDDPVEVEVEAPTSLASEARRVNTFSPLDPDFHRRVFDSGFNFTTHEPFVMHPRQVREIPIEVKGTGDHPSQSGHSPTIVDVTETEKEHPPSRLAPVIIDEVDDEPDSPARQSGRPYTEDVRPSAPVYDNLPDYSNDIEEEMIQAAIEASKQEAQESSDPMPQHRSSDMEEYQLAKAVSLSFKTAEQRKGIHEQGSNSGVEDSGASTSCPFQVENHLVSKGKLDANSSGQDEFVDLNEQPLVPNSSRNVQSVAVESATEAGAAETIPSSSPEQHLAGNRHLYSGNSFPSDEWGGISSEEHDEAVMLEAAMFGGIPESGYRFPYAAHQLMRPQISYPQSMPQPPSPGLAAQRLIREQQDDEYLAALQADREKELKALEEAEARRLEEEAARSAAIEEERLKEEEARQKLEEEKELGRQLAAKEASLPQEPTVDDENAMNLLVRMPDGSRRGRRFLKSDQLLSLFHFIDVGRGVKPGTYRLVRPYPRRSFSNEESSLTLNELGLTSKQEALFLELI